MYIRMALLALLLLVVPTMMRTAAAQTDPDAEQEPADPFADDALPDGIDASAGVTDEGELATPSDAGEGEPAPSPAEPGDEQAQPTPAPAASETPPVLTVKGHVKLQAGVFVPLASDGFSASENRAFIFSGAGARRVQTSQSCDPIATPNIPCYPLDHGQEAGSLSMARSTLQLDGTWNPSASVTVRGVLRGVRALELDADEWAQIPTLSEDASERRQLAKEWVRETYYDELDVRQLYVEARASDSLSFRLGRQLSRDTGQYRLLDVINPHNETWHFGPLESFEDTRVPLWMMTSLIELKSIDHSLELYWVPLIDHPRDTVTAPLSLVGAWGIPYSNTPSPYVIGRKVFDYPGRELEDMRAGAHWKGGLGERARYSLLYYYTHQLSPPIPTTFDERLLDANLGLYDSGYLEQLTLEFPRQHLIGASLEYAFEAPVAKPTPPFGVPGGLVAKLEGLIEANRTYPVRTDSDSISGGRKPDPDVPGRWHFQPEEKLVARYALSLTRPTMIPALNAEMPFLFVAQFIHSIATGFDAQDKALLTEIPGYNDYEVREHQMTFAGAIATIYGRGFLVPKLLGGFVYPDSGFYSLDLGVNLSPQLGFHLTATDFFGKNPYERLGLFNDRDELNMSMLFKF